MNINKEVSGVYIINNVSKNSDNELYIKVGCSKHCLKRYKEIQASYKFNGIDDKLELLEIIPVKQYMKLEKHIHILLNHFRQLGEYFKLSEDKLHEKLFMINLADYK
jgi:hypothetical protein